MKQHFLSIKQPWASLVAYGAHKETRTWDTSFRGELIICATAQKIFVSGEIFPHGVAIAVVEMVGTKKTKKGYEFVFENTRQIYPVKVTGQQRIFTLHKEIKIKYLHPDDDHVEVFNTGIAL